MARLSAVAAAAVAVATFAAAATSSPARRSSSSARHSLSAECQVSWVTRLSSKVSEVGDRAIEVRMLAFLRRLSHSASRPLAF